MNKKQEILDCIKTLNLTQEQANRLADVLASGGEGGSNKSVKFFTEYWDSNLTKIKINDKEIPYEQKHEGDIGTVYLINKQDFNYIENAIKNCTEVYVEEIDETQHYNMSFGVNVMYQSSDYCTGYVIKSVNEVPMFNSFNVFKLIRMDSKYYFLF